MSIIYCLLISALLVIAVIDWRTFEIPLGINVFILILGVIATVLERGQWLSHLLGLVVVSVPLLIAYLVTKGRGIGGGDIKLMFAAGLVLGWQLTLVGFMIGSVLAIVIHMLRMQISKKDHVLAFGPYLSAGMLLAVWFGKFLVNWYLSLYA